MMGSVSVRFTRSAALAAATTALLSVSALPVHAVDDPDTGTTGFSTTGPDADAGSDFGTSTGTDFGSDFGTGTGTSTADDEFGSAGTGAGDTSLTGRGSSTVSVTPAVVKAGADVQLRVRGCKGKRGTAKSEAFVADAQLAFSTKGGEGVLFAEATVRSTTSPGTYKISSGHCDAEGSVTVVSASASAASSDSLRPIAPVRAGGGGTAIAEEHDGPGAAQVILGLGLAGSAVVAFAGIAAHRRRSSSSAD